MGLINSAVLNYLDLRLNSEIKFWFLIIICFAVTMSPVWGTSGDFRSKDTRSSVQLLDNGERSFKQPWSPTLYSHEWLVHVWFAMRRTGSSKQGAGWVLSQLMLNVCFIVSQTCSHLNLDFHTSQLHWTFSTYFLPGSPLKLRRDYHDAFSKRFCRSN